MRHMVFTWFDQCDLHPWISLWYICVHGTPLMGYCWSSNSRRWMKKKMVCLLPCVSPPLSLELFSYVLRLGGGNYTYILCLQIKKAKVRYNGGNPRTLSCIGFYLAPRVECHFWYPHFALFFLSIAWRAILKEKSILSLLLKRDACCWSSRWYS